MDKLTEKTGEEYLEAVARLAPHLHKRPQVLTHDGPGQLVGIDLDQDLGYPIAVRRAVPGPVYSKVFNYPPDWVVLLPEVRTLPSAPAFDYSKAFRPLPLDYNPQG
jgi:hypothetical protein